MWRQREELLQFLCPHLILPLRLHLIDQLFALDARGDYARELDEKACSEGSASAAATDGPARWCQVDLYSLDQTGMEQLAGEVDSLSLQGERGPHEDYGLRA